LLITAVRNTVEQSCSKLKLTFHRSTMTDEGLTMISIESETAKTLDMAELIKTSSMKTGL